MHGAIRIERKPAGGPGGCGKHADGGSRMPPLRDMLRRAVDERGMRRGKPQARAPHRALASEVERFEPSLENTSPGKVRPVKRAAERIENQELDAMRDFRRNRLVSQPGDELRDPAR